MSTLRKPSTIDAITRAAELRRDPVIAEMDAEGRRERAEHAAAAPRPKRVKVTLYLDPDLYHDLRAWASRQADALELAKLDDQKALRGLIRGVIGSIEATDAARRGISNEVRGIK